VSTITYRVVKQILKFNVLKFIFLKIDIVNKLVVGSCVNIKNGVFSCRVVNILNKAQLSSKYKTRNENTQAIFERGSNNAFRSKGQKISFSVRF
jgi:hypothetical protein